MEYPNALSRSYVVCADRVHFLLRRHRGGLFPTFSFNGLKHQRLRRSLYIGGYAAIVRSNLSKNTELPSNHKCRFSQTYQKPLLCKRLSQFHALTHSHIQLLNHFRYIIHWARPKHCVIAYQLGKLAHKTALEPRSHQIVALSPLKSLLKEQERWEDLIPSYDNQVVTKLPL